MSRAFRLAAFGAFGTLAGVVAAERWLSRSAEIGRGPDASVRTAVLVKAPVERVWVELADLEGQVRWMHDARAIRVLTPGPVVAGTIAEADVRIFGIGTTDPIVITAWEPPRRFAIDHLGRFKGHGEMVLSEGQVPGSTLVTWSETLLAPIFPHVSAIVLRPLLRRVFQADLDRLAALAEARGEAGR